MITKEQYLQAKKTVADYELQEYLSGNSGLLKEPARGKTILEEAKERGYKQGSVVVLSGIEFNLAGDPYEFRGELMCDTGRDGSKILIHNPATGFWAPIKESTKSPLQDAMDRGYRKGAVIRVGWDNHVLINDPVFINGCVIAAVMGPFKDVWEATIWTDRAGYVAEMIKEAPENK